MFFLHSSTRLAHVPLVAVFVFVSLDEREDLETDHAEELAGIGRHVLPESEASH
jgi:hypothetical protein